MSLLHTFNLRNSFFFFQNVPHGRIPCQLEGPPRNSGLSAAPESLPPASCPPGPAGNAPLHLLSPPSVLPKAPTLPAAAALRPGDAFPLLQLRPEQGLKPFAFPAERALRVPPRCLPPPREAWGPPSSRQAPAPPRAMHTSAAPGTRSQRQAAEQKTGAGAGMTDIPKHLNLDQYVGQESMTPQQGSSAVTKPEGVFDVKPGPLESSPRYAFGFPLLHLQPKPAFTFFSVARAPVAVPSAPVRAAAGAGTHPGFSFLRSCPSQENAVIIWPGRSSAACAFYTVTTALSGGAFTRFLRKNSAPVTDNHIQVQFRIIWGILKV